MFHSKQLDNRGFVSTTAPIFKTNWMGLEKNIADIPTEEYSEWQPITLI